jgi:hypothetical protein
MAPRECFLAVEPLAPEDSPLRHTCAEGHCWTEQPDGTVSPSWGATNAAGRRFSEAARSRPPITYQPRPA